VLVPILYVHGVAIRNDDYWLPLEQLLRAFIAPVIAGDPENVWIQRCYWAHGGYLVRPSFFRKFAGRVLVAKEANWLRSTIH